MPPESWIPVASCFMPTLVPAVESRDNESETPQLQVGCAFSGLAYPSEEASPDRDVNRPVEASPGEHATRIHVDYLHDRVVNALPVVNWHVLPSIRTSQRACTVPPLGICDVNDGPQETSALIEPHPHPSALRRVARSEVLRAIIPREPVSIPCVTPYERAAGIPQLHRIAAGVAQTPELVAVRGSQPSHGACDVTRPHGLVRVGTEKSTIVPDRIEPMIGMSDTLGVPDCSVQHDCARGEDDRRVGRRWNRCRPYLAQAGIEHGQPGIPSIEDVERVGQSDIGCYGVPELVRARSLPTDLSEVATL